MIWAFKTTTAELIFNRLLPALTRSLSLAQAGAFSLKARMQCTVYSTSADLTRQIPATLLPLWLHIRSTRTISQELRGQSYTEF